MLSVVSFLEILWIGLFSRHERFSFHRQQSFVILFVLFCFQFCCLFRPLGGKRKKRIRCLVFFGLLAFFFLNRSFLYFHQGLLRENRITSWHFLFNSKEHSTNRSRKNWHKIG